MQGCWITLQTYQGDVNTLAGEFTCSSYETREKEDNTNKRMNVEQHPNEPSDLHTDEHPCLRVLTGKQTWNHPRILRPFSQLFGEQRMNVSPAAEEEEEEAAVRGPEAEAAAQPAAASMFTLDHHLCTLGAQRARFYSWFCVRGLTSPAAPKVKEKKQKPAIIAIVCKTIQGIVKQAWEEERICCQGLTVLPMWEKDESLSDVRMSDLRTSHV